MARVFRVGRIRAAWTTRAAERTGEGNYRVLRCREDVVDTHRPLQPAGFGYTVSDRVNEGTQTVLAAEGYPFSPAADLRPQRV